VAQFVDRKLFKMPPPPCLILLRVRQAVHVCVYMYVGSSGVCTPRSQFQCDTGHCVSITFVCDGDYDCSDASDEHQCRTGPYLTRLCLLSVCLFVNLFVFCVSNMRPCRLNYNTITHRCKEKSVTWSRNSKYSRKQESPRRFSFQF